MAWTAIDEAAQPPLPPSPVVNVNLDDRFVRGRGKHADKVIEKKAVEASEKENVLASTAVSPAPNGQQQPATAAGAIFSAHRQFITSCVEQLEVHTWMLSQAETQQKTTGDALVDYVGGLEALLIERQAALSTLQTQLQTFRLSLPTDN